MGIKRYVISQFGHPRGLVGRLAGAIMASKNRERIEWTIEKLDVAPSDRILEIGFGPGVSIELLAQRASEGFIAGIEVSETMLAQATVRNRAAIDVGRVELEQGTVDSIPYGESTFDKVLAINSHMFWDDLPRALEELDRVLKPGGALVIVFQPPTAEGQRQVETTASRLSARVEQSGFIETAIQVEPMKGGQTIWMRSQKPAAPHLG